MRLKLSFIFAVTLLSYFCLAQGQETLTITTYYPSPYGSYKQLYVSGDVGIGTVGPYSKETIYDNADYNPTLTVQTRALFNVSNGLTDLVFGIDQTSPYSAWIQHRHWSSSGNYYPIALNPLGGNVGIGTTSPSTLLHILAADNTTAQTITINAAQASVTASDTFIDFRSTTGLEGSIAGTATAGLIAYNTFTGSHYTQVAEDIKLEPNMLLEIIEGKPPFSKEQLFKTQLCATKKSKKAVGVWGGRDKEGRDMVLSMGTGCVIVANKGKDIEIGDLLYSSDVAGCVELQVDDLVHNYTVAKATEPIKWKQGEVTRTISCILMGG